MAIFTDLIMAIFMFQSNKTQLEWKKKNPNKMISRSTVWAHYAGQWVSHFWVSGKRACQGSVAHRHTPSRNKCNAKRRIFFFFLTHHKTTTHSLCHGTRVVQTRSLCLSPLPSAFLVFAAVFGGSCSSLATAGSQQFARLEKRRSRHALRPALCRHHHCLVGGS